MFAHLTGSLFQYQNDNWDLLFWYTLVLMSIFPVSAVIFPKSETAMMSRFHIYILFPCLLYCFQEVWFIFLRHVYSRMSCPGSLLENMPPIFSSEMAHVLFYTDFMLNQNRQKNDFYPTPKQTRAEYDIFCCEANQSLLVIVIQ